MSGRLRGVRLLMRVARWTRLPPGIEVGAELAADGQLRTLRAGRGHRTSRSSCAAAASRASCCWTTRGPPVAAAAGSRARSTRMRRRAERAVAAGLPPPEAALARGMVLGQDERDRRHDARRTGATRASAHLLAVSGQNVMLLVALARAAARAGAGRAGGARRWRSSGWWPSTCRSPAPGPSLQRAGVMGAAGIAAMTLSRPASRWYALLLAAAVTLALNPRASADPGWQLSFAAVAGILALGRPLAAALARAGGGAACAQPRRAPSPPVRALVRGFADGVAITLAATLATGPLVAFHFGAVPLAGLVANLLALPAVAPAMWLGMVKAALGHRRGGAPAGRRRGRAARAGRPGSRSPTSSSSRSAAPICPAAGSRCRSTRPPRWRARLRADRRGAGRAPARASGRRTAVERRRRPRRAGRRLAARPALVPGGRRRARARRRSRSPPRPASARRRRPAT